MNIAKVRDSQSEARGFSRFANTIATWFGSPQAAIAALSLVVVWAVCGPYFGFSDQWQIFINTIATIVTFLMGFIIQSSQNRDGLALQLKLDELIYAVSNARNKMIGLENRDEAALKELHGKFEEVADTKALERQNSSSSRVRGSVKRRSRKKDVRA